MSPRKRKRAPKLVRTPGMGADLKPRDYQVELVDKALKENGIIFMPTGSGKTFVASLLIKELGGTILTKEFADGGKRTFFLVNTVQLVTQQAQCVRNQTPYSVGQYSGDMNVDFWSKEQWMEEMENEVLVMTAQIFLNLILHDFIQFRNVNLLILDECHHARSNHAMAQIMNLFKAYHDERPHILGLTATLLNSNVKNTDTDVYREIRNLESTLCAKVLTPSDSEVVKRFSTNPTEKIILFAEQKASHPSQQFMYSLTEKLVKVAAALKMPDRNVTPIEIVENAKLMNKKKGWADHLKNMLKQIEDVSEDLGVNAASKCVLALIVRFERMKLHASDVEVIYLLNMFITKLHFLRKCLEDTMSDCEIGLRPVKYSTPKMQELLGILKNMNKDDSVLVFVELRFTAKVLYYVVEELARNNSDFSHVKADFIVGYNNNPMNDVKEMMYEKKANASTLERFNSKVSNVLFASAVIEEGTDISHCNYVLKFDRMKTFRSYVQSKGRARHKDSIYVVFCSEHAEVRSYESYRKIEKKLSDLLARSIRSTDMGDYESDPIEPFAPFGPDGPKVTVYSAISLINRYTSMLPQDKFANLATFWWSRSGLNNEGRVCAILQLPINSAIKYLIEGPYCNNEADAKRAAALVACRKLFEAGELDCHLLPRGDDSDALHDQEIFTHWPEQEPKSAHKAGTKKRLQLYKMHCPRWVFGCQPRSGVKLYLHVLYMKPVFETRNSVRLEAFKNHLGCRQQFAMLSTKPLPKITEFTLFTNMGEVDIGIFEAADRVALNQQELKKVFEFHTLLFTEVLTMGKKFFVRDHENAENSYWVVPVLSEKPREAKIDWETIEKHTGLPEVRPVSSDERATWHIRGADYIGKVVVPWYRGSGGLPSVRYIVTKVCESDSPFSPFPSDAYSTYAEYFHLRYGERVVNAHQPLIEVRAISSKINCLKPRGTYKTSSKKKREDGDLEETLIPELCTLIEFPAAYILKSTLLPSLLHRLHHILGAEELREKIVTEAGLGELDPPGGRWRKLTVDNFAVQPEEEPSAKSTIGVSDLLNENMEALTGNIYPWKPEDEPKDIEKQLNNVDLLSIIHYNKFLISSKEERPDLEGFMRSFPVNGVGMTGETPAAEPLSILDVNPSASSGPQISDILPAITSIRASDIVNYERLETLGDSFLKFSVSLSLFLNYPEMDEGKLTQIKGKIVGNRNLYYCGRDLGLGERLKARDFVPDEWNVPSFSVVPTLKDILSKNHLSPHPFYGIILTKDEINSGLLSDESLSQANAVLNSLLDDESEAHSKANNYSLLQLGLQPVPDKVIADSVEALLGVYLQSFGTRGALQLAKYLGILPEKLCQVSELLDAPPPSAARVQESLLQKTLNMIKAAEIESILGYKFKDRSYLVQAFTHSSATHFATDCYQRLEFLGDAVLDFLITMHIYESCGKLSPGELTDLRSALVNNITFSCLAVKYNLHKHLFSKAYSLTEVITDFAERQAKRGHAIGAEVSFLIEESDVSVAESVEVPKVLGDLFESVVAAVYLDSGKCLKTTWNVVYKLMYNEIKSFTQNVPKNNIRLLYEKFPNPLPTFGKSRVLEDGRVLVPLEVVQYGPIDLERKLFTGMGLTKAAAKNAAAKMALRHFHRKSQS